MEDMLPPDMVIDDLDEELSCSDSEAGRSQRARWQPAMAAGFPSLRNLLPAGGGACLPAAGAARLPGPPQMQQQSQPPQPQSQRWWPKRKSRPKPKRKPNPPHPPQQLSAQQLLLQRHILLQLHQYAQARQAAVALPQARQAAEAPQPQARQAAEALPKAAPAAKPPRAAPQPNQPAQSEPAAAQPKPAAAKRRASAPSRSGKRACTLAAATPPLVPGLPYRLLSPMALLAPLPAVVVAQPAVEAPRAPRGGASALADAAVTVRVAAKGAPKAPGQRPPRARPPGLGKPGAVEVRVVEARRPRTTGGIVLIAPPTRGSVVVPVPPVVVDTARRVNELPLGLSPAQLSEGDALAGTLQCLRCLARSVGRLQQSIHEPRLAGRLTERLARLVMARTGRVTKPTAARRSVRVRAAPAQADSMPKPDPSVVPSEQAGRASEPPLAPQQQQPKAAQQHGVEPESPGLETSTRLGRCFQCVVPSSPLAAPRSIAIPASEAIWIGTQVLPEGAPELPSAAPAPASEHSRRKWIAERSAQLVGVLGANTSTALGLRTMGAAPCAPLLDGWAQAAFGQGLHAHGREFSALRAEHLPGMPVGTLVTYYYDVWKLRATPMAERWYQEEERAALAEQESEARAAKAAAQRAKAAAKPPAQCRSRGRQIKDLIGWTRAAARSPRDSNINSRVVMRDRVLRVLSEVLPRCGTAQPSAQQSEQDQPAAAAAALVIGTVSVSSKAAAGAEQQACGSAVFRVAADGAPAPAAAEQASRLGQGQVRADGLKLHSVLGSGTAAPSVAL